MVRRRLKKNTPLQSLPDFRSGISKDDRSASLVRRERGERKEKGKRILAGLASVAVLTAGGLWLQANRVNTVNILVSEGAGAVVLPEIDSIRSSAESYLNESLLNRWLVDHDKLAQLIRNDNQDVAQISLIEQEAGSLSVTVAPRERAVVWQKGKDFFEVDSSGVAYQTAEKDLIDGNVHVVDQSSLPVVVGEPVASRNTINHIVNLVKAMDSNDKIEIANFISPNAAREVHIRLVGKPFTVRTTIDQSAEVLAASLGDTLLFFEQQKVTPRSVIDLRVVGRAIYR